MRSQNTLMLSKALFSVLDAPWTSAIRHIESPLKGQDHIFNSSIKFSIKLMSR